MSGDPTRIVDGAARSLADSAGGPVDVDVAARLARDLRIARDVPGAELDVDAGLRRLSAAIGAGGAALGSDLPGTELPAGEPGSAAASLAPGGAPGPAPGAASSVGVATGAAPVAAASPGALALKTVIASAIVAGAVATATVTFTAPHPRPAPPAASTAVAHEARPTAAIVPQAPALPMPPPVASIPVDARERVPLAETPPRAASSSPRGPASAAARLPDGEPPGAPRLGTPSPHAAAPGGSMKPEMEQLATIRQATDPATALALADAGHARFPRGVFWQEREALAIAALARLGRGADARARAGAFVVRHPESPYAGELRRLAGEAP